MCALHTHSGRGRRAAAAARGAAGGRARPRALRARGDPRGGGGAGLRRARRRRVTEQGALWRWLVICTRLACITWLLCLRRPWELRLKYILSVTHSQLRSIPSDISLLQRLVVLNLSHNSLEALPQGGWCMYYTELTGLSLWVRHCSLSQLGW